MTAKSVLMRSEDLRPGRLQWRSKEGGQVGVHALRRRPCWRSSILFSVL